MHVSQKIRKRSEFLAIFNQGRFSRGKLINLWIYERPGQDGLGAKPKIGIIVSRKAHSGAVKRNLWKRRMREVFRHKQHLIRNGIELLIQAKPQPKVPAYEALKGELERLLMKAGVWGKISEGKR